MSVDAEQVEDQRIFADLEKSFGDERSVSIETGAFAAGALESSGRSSSRSAMFFNSIAGFLRSYVVKQDFRDGVPGLIIAMFTGYGVFLKYAKLWERKAKSE